jgi:hypothetical protein
MVYNYVDGFLEQSQFMLQTADGKTVRIDASLMTDETLELKADDLITLDTPEQDQYTVYDVQENPDAIGVVHSRTYRLVKVQAQS